MAAKVRGLQLWCRRQCEGYRDVTVTNMTSSWKSGLAFCAIIHRYRPDLINYDRLSKDNVYGNNKLAFDTASEQLGIPALLDPEDMLAMSVPDKLCIITYVAQYYNYFHDKTPASASEVGSQQSNQVINPSSAERPNDLGVIPDANTTTTRQFLSPTEDDFLRGMSANVAHRRGSVVDDTCFRCGERVYLLERHLAPTGQLFHRHCYRDSERTATLQRAASRRRPSCQKENVLPLTPEQDVAASSGRTGRRKSSTSNAAPAAPRSSGKSQNPDKESLQTVAESKSAGAAPKKAATGVSANNLTAPVVAAVNTKNSTTKETPSTVQKPLVHGERNTGVSIRIKTSSNQNENARISHANTAATRNRSNDDKVCEAPVKMSSMTINVASSAHASTVGAKEVVRACKSVSMRTQSPSDRRREVVIPSLTDRARPTQSITTQSEASTSKSASRDDLVPGRATMSPLSPNNNASTSVSSTERSCDVIQVTDPARLVFRSTLSPSYSADNVETSAEAVTGPSAEKNTDRLLTNTRRYPALSPPSSTKGRISTSSESSSKHSSLSDLSLSPLSPSLSISPRSTASINPSKSAVSSVELRIAADPERRSPTQSRTDDLQTPAAIQRNIYSKKQDSSKERRLYRPKSLENIIEPSEPYDSGKVSRTFQVSQEEDTVASLASEAGKTSDLPTSKSPPHDNGSFFRRPLVDRKTDRPKSSYDFLSTSPNTKPYHSVIANAARSRNDPTVKGLLDNLMIVAERKRQDADQNKGKETACRTPDVIMSVNSRPTIVVKSKETATARKPGESTPTSGAVGRQATSPRNTSPQLKDDTTTVQNEDASLISPRSKLVKKTSPKVEQRGSDESAGDEKCLTKWQAELRRRRETRLNQHQQLINRRTVHESQLLKPGSPDFNSNTASVNKEAESPVNATSRLSNKLSKSVDDLSEPTGSAAAAAVGKSGREEQRMTEWQMEVERRRAARGGRYVDPEKVPVSQRQQAPRRAAAENVRQSMYELGDSTPSSTDDHTGTKGSDWAPALPQRDKKSNMSASLDNLTECHLARDTPRSNLRARQASADDRVQARASRDMETSVYESLYSRCDSSDQDYCATENYYESIDDYQESGAVSESPQLPATVLHSSSESDLLRRKPNNLRVTQLVSDSQNNAADVSPQDAEIFRRLDELDAALRELELEGRLLEERIRSETDEAMDEKTDEMMVEWFKLVRKRNELIREESALIYKRRQQELEGLHNELQYQLQSVMRKPDAMKSQADWQLETSLLRELVDTVTKRSTIVENMETDRLRYEEEDKELEQMIAASGVLGHRRNSGNSTKSRRNSIRRKKTLSDNDVTQAGNLTKLKKKKFSIFSLARKSLPTKKGLRAVPENGAVTAR